MIERLEMNRDDARREFIRAERFCCRLAKQLVEIDAAFHSAAGWSEKRNELFEDLSDGLITRLRQLADWHEAEEKLAEAESRPRQVDMFDAR